MPLIRTFLDPEKAHELAVFCTSNNLIPKDAAVDPEILRIQAFGKSFPNPIGMAAGFDKNAVSIEGVLDCGFGFVEIGSVTPNPQSGNAKPRVFRLPEDKGIINRYGFNSDGMESVRSELIKYQSRKAVNMLSLGTERDQKEYRGHRPGLLGINLGKNKSTEDAAADYVAGVQALGEFADYMVVNVSSPNTPGLRSLQGKEQLEKLLRRVHEARDAIATKENRAIPLLLKIAPDLNNQDKQDIADVALDLNVDGLIVSNTTLQRPAFLKSKHKDEAGGLSGAPLRELSTKVLSDMYSLTKGEIPLIGVGGVSTGQDVYDKIKAGATLVQMYSCLIYDGPLAVARAKKDLIALLQRDGYEHVTQAIGASHRIEKNQGDK